MTAGAAACGLFKRVPNDSRDAIAGSPIEVRNGAEVGVNVYLLGRSGIHFQSVFLGQVPSRTARTFCVHGAAAGDTVWLRARPLDGRPEFARDDVVVGPGAIWSIP
jgi:hypothetical protein